MANSVVWNIVSMDHKLPLGTTPPNGQVTNLHWIASLTDDSGETTVSCYGVETLGEPDPDNYIPYEDIGKTRSVQWVETAIGNQRIEGITKYLTDQLNEALNPTKAGGLPWVKNIVD
tara:strand:- start:93 stop:443 length:351 start_codon:yes stop_codon:yes gene_type:complete